MGDGAVDWAGMARIVSEARFAGPISLHLEYDIAGSTAAERTSGTLAAAVKDLAYAKRFFK
jgi:sugar phosphate isomerase/epimerase